MQQSVKLMFRRPLEHLLQQVRHPSLDQEVGWEAPAPKC
jgi:hypothetical protein